MGLITLGVFIGTAAGALLLAVHNHLGLAPTLVAVLVGGGAPAGLFLAWATYRLAADQAELSAMDRAESSPKPASLRPTAQVGLAFPTPPTNLPDPDRTTDPHVQERITALNEALDRHSIRARARDWILYDQLPSGGWGKSLVAVTSLANRRQPTNLERSEGGILTTFVSLSALRNYESKHDSFLAHKSSRAALEYLIAHQGTDGGFGRFVESRSGTELMRGDRHTTFALCALLDLAGPGKVISAGLDFLTRRSPLREWSDDAAPSMLIAGLLNLHQRLRGKSVTELGPMNDQVYDWLNSFDPVRLYSELASASTSTQWAPLWKPYGSQPDLLFDTAVRTISMLPRPLEPEIRPTVIRALENISEYEREGGIPYAPQRLVPDIGMSVSIMSTLIGLIPGDLENSNHANRFNELADSLLNFITSNWIKPQYREMLYSETIAYALLVGVPI